MEEGEKEEEKQEEGCDEELHCFAYLSPPLYFSGGFTDVEIKFLVHGYTYRGNKSLIKVF